MVDPKGKLLHTRVYGIWNLLATSNFFCEYREILWDFLGFFLENSKGFSGVIYPSTGPYDVLRFVVVYAAAASYYLFPFMYNSQFLEMKIFLNH